MCLRPVAARREAVLTRSHPGTHTPRLLHEKKHVTAESGDESQNGLLSPGSTAGFVSEERRNPAQSGSWGGSWTPLESTPGGPHLEYSLDDPAHILASQHVNPSSRRSSEVDRCYVGTRGPSSRGDIQQGEKGCLPR